MKIKLPSEITPEEAKRDHIPRTIIAPPTEEELRTHKLKAQAYHEHAASLLISPQWMMDLEQARRGEVVWKNEVAFVYENYDLLGAEEATKRIRAAMVNLSDALIRQGKLDEAQDVAFEGMRIGANTIEFYQKAIDFTLAVNADDNDWCNCDDEVFINDDPKVGKVFGGSGVEGEILPSLQVVDEIPSVRHNGEMVSVVKCARCGRYNAVPKNALPNYVLDVDRDSHPQLQTARLESGDVRRISRSNNS